MLIKGGATADPGGAANLDWDTVLDRGEDQVGYPFAGDYDLYPHRNIQYLHGSFVHSEGEETGGADGKGIEKGAVQSRDDLLSALYERNCTLQLFRIHRCDAAPAPAAPAASVASAARAAENLALLQLGAECRHAVPRDIRRRHAPGGVCQYVYHPRGAERVPDPALRLPRCDDGAARGVMMMMMMMMMMMLLLLLTPYLRNDNDV